jgi:hypothetical protein
VRIPLVRRVLPRQLVAGVLAAAIVLGGATIPLQAAGAVDAPRPSWWDGDCDANHWNTAAAAKGWTGEGAHRLGASYLGVPVCGPRPGADDAPDVTWTRPGWGEYEWECVELAMRFMVQVYGVSPYNANGGDVVRNYQPSAGGGLVTVGNGTAGQAPQPGDVISFDRPGGYGHVLVVTGTSVDGAGNGTVRTMSQNDTADGWRDLTVENWVVKGWGSYTPYAWLHDPAGRGGSGVSTSGTFVDIGGDVHAPMIEAIAARGVTLGCDAGARRYCPDLAVTRGQMATFLARALDLPPSSIDYFADDDGSVHEDAINRLADANIATGYSDGTFRVDGDLTRGEMARFLARAFDTPEASADRFDDVAGSAASAINSVAAAGITLGCTSDGTRFCPDDTVRRDQMASFLGRALGLTAPTGA